MSTEEMVQQFDAEPQFWQFLSGLTLDDLVVELIQNELDAGSSHTIISFFNDHLSCQGNGNPIDDDGWKRLSFVLGAGQLVPRKRHRFGVKNHGLKVCFQIGDEIVLRSAGRMTRQTLYKNGPQSLPSPGALKQPMRDESAPKKGCIIEVPYRTRKLSVTNGEPLELLPTTAKTITNLYLDACRDLPGRLIGALRPGIRKSYTLDLHHHVLGQTRLKFTCGKSKNSGKFTFYNRSCRVHSTLDNLPKSIYEGCSSFSVEVPPETAPDIPDFFRPRNGRFIAEISWASNSRGVPIAFGGNRKYPISYSGKSNSALSGVGVHFSGPYSSDSSRHGVIENAPFNNHIDDVCKNSLIAVLRDQLIPRHGPRMLELLMTAPQSPNLDSLKDLVDRALSAGAIPLLQKTSRTTARSKRFKRSFFSPSESKRIASRLVLPIFTWESSTISPLLSSVCPRDSVQIDPTVPKPILRLLDLGSRKEWSDTIITFNEDDAITRLQPELTSKYFPWQDEDEWKKSLKHPETARTYLDIIVKTIDSQQYSEALTDAATDSYLPDTEGNPVPLHELFAATNLPPKLRGHEMPPIIHPTVGSHSLFRKKDWKMPQYGLDEYIAKSNLEIADEGARKAFWDWLKTNWRIVPKASLRMLADLQIWPDDSGALVSLSDFCRPNSSRVRNILKDDLQIPSADVLKIRPIREAKAGLLAIRTRPTNHELTGYLTRRLSHFSTTDKLLDPAIHQFHRFEAEIVELAKNGLGKQLVELDHYAMALNRCCQLRRPADLVRSNRKDSTLHILDEYIIKRSTRLLHRLGGWGTMSSPSSTQILETLRKDSKRVNSHLARLRAYRRAAMREGITANEIRTGEIKEIECIPFNGGVSSSASLAFSSPRGNYWGKWKGMIRTKGMSAEDQAIYRDIGVLAGEPSQEQSHSFFRWLNSGSQSTTAEHLDQILRHINHRNGPKAWKDEHPNTEFIPVESDNGLVRLASAATAIRARSTVVIPDFEAVEDIIRASTGPRKIDLAIVKQPNVTEPIALYLQQLGVKSLRAYLGEPIRVTGAHPRPAPQNLREELDRLRSPRMGRELRKRLEDFGIGLNIGLRRQWQDRLDHVDEIQIGKPVVAEFKVRTLHIAANVECAFDLEAGTLWLVDDNSQEEDLFYQAIADRIFENPEKFIPIVLKEAVRRDFKEHAFVPTTIDLETDDGAEAYDPDEQNAPGPVDETVETKLTHHGTQPNPKKNLPNPSKIPTNIPGTGSGGKRNRRQGRVRSRVEEEHSDDLRQNQYAWHCQVCLANLSVSTLAPDQSYVGIQENRQGIIRVHHPDQFHVGGARHAGNLLILCIYHRDYFGDAINNQMIAAAIQERSIDHEIVFRTAQIDGSSISVPGKLVSVRVPSRDTDVQFFFTNPHAEYWIAKADE